MAANTKTAQKKPTQPRVRRLDRRTKKKAVKTQTKVASGTKILGRTLRHMWRYKKLFLGVFVVYLALYVLLVRGLATGFQLGETNDYLKELFGDELDAATTGATLLGVLVGTAGSAASDAGGVYQMLLVIIISLATIWLFRQTYDERAKVRVRDAFYLSTYPLVSFLLVSLVIILQLLPVLISTSLFSIVTSNGIAVGAVEQIAWFVVLLLGAGLSLFWLSSSIFALYIVTLPNTGPMVALRSARKLVKYRRWLIIRRLLFLPITIILFVLLVFFPLVLVAPLAAELLFMFLSLLGLFLLHGYVYALYRELL